MNMKQRYLSFLGTVFLAYIVIGCEDIVEIDLPSSKPRLIVDAVFRVDIDAEFIPVEVNVTETSNFFEEVPVTSLENIIIVITTTDSLGIDNSKVRTLAELKPGTGIYIPDPNFSSDQRIRTSEIEQDSRYDLIIMHKGRRYLAQTKYVPAVPIDTIAQGSETLFGNEDTEVIVGITDDPDRENFYVFDFNYNEFLVTDDAFYKGQEFKFSYFYDRTFTSGKAIEVSILGADIAFYNYMDQLIEQSAEPQGPFQTPVTTVRGNVFDITDLDNQEIFDNVEQANVFPLGYFAIVQEYKSTITIQ